MTATATRRSFDGLFLPAALLLGLGTLIAFQSGLVDLNPPERGIPAPETVVVPARSFAYRAGGDYLRDGKPVEAPLVAATAPALEIMTFEVSAADYARCVADAACRPAEPKRHGSGDIPVTGVNFTDANDYAAWLSDATGITWRLPTLDEWIFAAGSQAVDPVLDAETDDSNPADRWLAQYEKEAALGVNAFATPEPRGSFGSNEFGVADMLGPVWEWTATCATRTVFDAAGTQLSHLDSCGVRYLEGRHRAAMSYFVRDGRSGGCAVGAPPDNIGFRLVREPSWIETLFGRR